MCPTLDGIFSYGTFAVAVAFAAADVAVAADDVVDVAVVDVAAVADVADVDFVTLVLFLSTNRVELMNYKSKVRPAVFRNLVPEKMNIVPGSYFLVAE